MVYIGRLGRGSATSRVHHAVVYREGGVGLVLLLLIVRRVYVEAKGMTLKGDSHTF